jgi:D-glycero-alpha-D-manno-heptose-7-phosphate kinase
MPTKQQLAQESIYVEQEILKEAVGSQDQVSAAYGGFNHITFLPNGAFSVRPITLSPERIKELNSHLMLFYTGIKRTSSHIAESYVNDIEARRRQLRIMKDLIEESISVLNNGDDISGFGELLHEAWQAKRSLSSAVSNPYVDEIYEAAISAGALGGKLTGAGGGGFILLFVPPSKKTEIREKLNNLIHVPFKMEFSGSQIIFFDSEEDYYLEERDRDRRPIQAFQELF